MQILDAIASHPGGAESVLMVATDGICFDNPHPSLSISKKLGEWEESLYHDLTLFKPGVYWHRKGKDAVLDAKTRGVPKAALLECLDLADQQFQSWQAQKAFPGGLVNESISETLRVRTIFGWPYLDVPVSFRMTSCAQALNMGKWGEAGKVETDFYMRQDCDPHEKRFSQAWNPSKSRLDSFVHPVLDTERTTPYGAAEYPEIPDIGYGLDGPVMNTVAETLGALHETVEWTTVYDKG
jgi:hypothetical protein